MTFPPAAAGMYLSGPLHRRGASRTLHWYSGQQDPHRHICGGLGPDPGSRPHQEHPGSHERQRGLQWCHSLCLCSHGLLQHLRHLGPPPLCGGKREDAPGEKEGFQDGADHLGHHRGKLPAAGGAHALCVLLLVCGIPLSDQHHRVLPHGSELQHRASRVHHEDGAHGRRWLFTESW